MSSASNTVSTSTGPNPAQLIQRERADQGSKFSLKSMHEFIEGLPEKSEKILSLYQSLERDPILQLGFEDYDLSKDENRLQTTERINRMTQYIELELAEDFQRRLNLVTVYDPSLGIRISVNLGLFANCIKGNGTDAQYKFWCVDKEASIMKQLWGCFGMTELGHGSNVAGCETTATFDKETDEFVINTPHIGATKWWIGGAAHSATHSSVYARLIVDGKDYGVKTFVVPLRDNTHNLLPGVSIGDIGGKMGRQGVDNGWIQFSNVRIPRFFMLQKFCKVSRDGKVELPPLEQLSYISLLGGRVYMATDSYRICARFITIAIRYAVGRRQFKAPNKAEETQLMDYPLHQRRLLPYLALTYAAALGTNKLEQQHTQVLKDLEKAVELKDMPAIKAGINKTKSLFVDSGSLKLTLTWLAADCINEARQSCGGQGYSAYNGFGKTFDDWVVQCTWEGDNNVLGMSAGRTIIRHVADAIGKGAKIDGSLAFLSNLKNLAGSEAVLTKNSDLDDAALILKAIEALIVRISVEALDSIKELKDWDSISYERVLLSKLRCHHYLLETFLELLAKNKDSQLTPYLNLVLKLYTLTGIIDKYSSEFLLYQVITREVKVHATSKEIKKQNLLVRPHVISLTDAFQQPDGLISSAIGKFNGDVYENYFDVVKKLNPPKKTKADYSSDLEGMLNRTSRAERERFEKGPEAAKILSK